MWSLRSWDTGLGQEAHRRWENEPGDPQKDGGRGRKSQEEDGTGLQQESPCLGVQGPEFQKKVRRTEKHQKEARSYKAGIRGK